MLGSEKCYGKKIERSVKIFFCLIMHENFIGKKKRNLFYIFFSLSTNLKFYRKKKSILYFSLSTILFKGKIILLIQTYNRSIDSRYKLLKTINEEAISRLIV